MAAGYLRVVLNRLRNWWLFRRGPIEFGPEVFWGAIADTATDLGDHELAGLARQTPPPITPQEAILRIERLKHPGVPDDQLIRRHD